MLSQADSEGIRKTKCLFKHPLHHFICIATSGKVVLPPSFILILSIIALIHLISVNRNIASSTCEVFFLIAIVHFLIAPKTLILSLFFLQNVEEPYRPRRRTGNILMKGLASE